MAIEKMPEKPKVEWTLPTILQLAGSVVLVGLSILFCWLAFANWRFKANLVEAYQEYDRGRPTAAKAPLEAALSWRPEHTGARELLAKLLCDEGKLDEARKQYQRLKAQGHDVPQVNVGLGVISLKEAQSLTQPRQVEALVNEAANAFNAAASTPEAQIGLGHCELVLAQKLNDPTHYPKAQAKFAKIREVMEKNKEIRSDITIDGLVDYYTGYGKALSSGDKYDEGARDAFRACFQYLPTSVSVLPMANVLSLEARRFAAFSDGNEALLKLQPDIVGLRNQAGAIWKSIRNPAEKDRLREPWLMYSLALAQAWGRAGNANEMQSIVRDLGTQSGFEGRMEPFILEAMIKTELAVKDDPNAAAQESTCARAQQTYNELIQKLPADDANKDRRLRCYNNAAWMLAWRGGYGSSEATYTQAIARLNEALRLAPDDYVVNRNMAVILKRFKKAPLAPGPFVEKCAAAAAADKTWAEDFDALKKYMESK